jgi:hypothetical protein
MKNQIILIALISIGIYIFLNSCLNEKFEDIIPFDRYLNNPIKNSLVNSSKVLDSINFIKPINKDNKNTIFDKTTQKITIEDQKNDETYNQKNLFQTQEILDIKNKVNSFMNDTVIVIPENTFKINSIKSLQNSQPINLTSLDNGKYMVNINGQCLKSTALNRTTVKSCNQDDPSQYFELNMIYEKDTYKNNIGDNPIIDNSTFKYPFSILKSSSNGNCLTNKDSILSTRPCIPDISQQWENSNDPIICTYQAV